MWKLIKLEWKKNRIGGYVRNAFLLAAALCLFLFSYAFCGIALDPDGTLDVAEGLEGISSAIELFTSISFLIFTGAMLASFIVGAYKNKTMDLMFSYPIKRQKILIAQMLAVWIFNFAALAATKLCLYLCIYLGSKTMESPFAIDFNMGAPSFYGQLLAKSFVTVTMGFIGLFVGLAMKSSKATLVSSFLLIFLTQATIGDYSLAGNGMFAGILTVLSIALAGFSIWKVELRDSE